MIILSALLAKFNFPFFFLPPPPPPNCPSIWARLILPNSASCYVASLISLALTIEKILNSNNSTSKSSFVLTHVDATCATTSPLTCIQLPLFVLPHEDNTDNRTSSLDNSKLASNFVILDKENWSANFWSLSDKPVTTSSWLAHVTLIGTFID